MPDSDASYPHGLLPVWLHLAFCTFGPAIGVLLGAGLAIAIDIGAGLPPGGLGSLIVIALALLGSLIPKYVMVKLVSARCPRCGGRAWSSKEPGRSDAYRMNYRCEHCGRQKDTHLRT